MPSINRYSICIKNIICISVGISPIYNILVYFSNLYKSSKFFTFLKVKCNIFIFIPTICRFPFYIENTIYINISGSFDSILKELTFINTICIFSIYKVSFSIFVNAKSIMFFTISKEIPSSSVINPPIS